MTAFFCPALLLLTCWIDWGFLFGRYADGALLAFAWRYALLVLSDRTVGHAEFWNAVDTRNKNPPQEGYKEGSMRLKLICFMMIAAMLLGTGSAWASVVNVDYGTTYSYWASNGEYLPTTQFSLDIDGFSTYGFCVDPISSIEKGNYSYSFLSWTPEFLQAAWLMDNYAPSEGVINTRRETVGLQASIWSAVTGSNYKPYYNTNFQQSKYNSWFGSLLNSLDDQTLANLQSEYKILLPFLTTASGEVLNKQALIVKYHSSPVPIPGAALLLGAGLLGIVGVRRKQAA